MKKYGMIKSVVNNRRIVSDSGYRNTGAVLLFLLLFPYVVSFFFGNAGEWKDEAAGEETQCLTAQMYREAADDSRFIVCNTTAAGIERIPMETYLIGRLPATIRTDYEPETLKAQAVVLRTELMRLYYDGMSGEDGKKMQKTEEGQILLFTESSLCMTDGKTYEKCRQAIESTKGMYLTSDGEPIKAPYFSVSAGATRNGNEVFESEEYPYLKSVMCERDFTAEEYAQSVSINRTAFALRFHEISPETVLTEDGQLADEMQIERDRADYVTKIGVGGHYVSGEAFRAAFLLNSSCFTIETEGDMVVLRTKGVGHGLGFCQYGANEAAKKGSDFIDILNYFFTDINIEKTE